MSEPPVEPLSRDVADLLRAVRQAPPLTPGAHARILARVRATLGIVGPGSAGGGSGAAQAAGGAAPTLAVAKPLVALLLIAGGALVTVKLTARGGVAPAPTTSIASPAKRERAPAPPAAPAPTPAPAPAPPPPPPPSPPARLPAPRVTRAPIVVAPRPEHAILEEGHIALKRRDAERALAAVAEHEVAYPSGQLVEEREALRVHALSAAGRSAEANAAAERFHQAFPRSIQGRAIDHRRAEPKEVRP